MADSEFDLQTLKYYSIYSACQTDRQFTRFENIIRIQRDHYLL